MHLRSHIRACLTGLMIGALAVLAAPALTHAQGPMTSPHPHWRPGSIPPAGLDQLIAKYNISGEFGFVLYDLNANTIIEEKSPSKPMTPASVTKTITALYALDTLGGGFRFSTSVLATGPITDGTLQGDLILTGTGDPTLDSDRLVGLAKTLRDRGLKRMTGQFYYDGSALPHLFQIDDKQPVYVGYNPAIGGLNLNFNRVFFEWSQTASGYATTMDARGNTTRPSVAFTNMTVIDRAGPLFTFAQNNGQEHWSVMRQALGKKGGRWLPVRDPNRYTADVFREIATSVGIALPRAKPGPKTNPATDNVTVLATDQSAPLADIVKDMLYHSTNLTAEIVGLAASRHAGVSHATLPQSASAMTQWAKTRLGMTQSTFHDHSGLGAKTQITARDMITALRVAPAIDPTFESLLKAVQTYTAKGQLDTSGAKVSAKTGTLNFVSALSGYLNRADGGRFAFAIFGQDLTARAKANNATNETPPGSKTWVTHARSLQNGLLYRWARLGS